MSNPVHILITGGTGQVGLELLAADWPQDVVLHAPSRSELELRDSASVRSAFTAAPIAAVINAGAYTAVDQAETDVAAAFSANAMGPALLAEATKKPHIPLLHVSSDYVFDGRKGDFYVESDPVNPLGVYGASKLAGELAVLSGNPRSIVLRTAWVLSAHRANFLKTMLRLAADNPVVRVVGDQRGCPTSARDIAAALKTLTLRMIDDPNAPTGVYNFVNAGETTWAGLANEIFARSAEAGGPASMVEAIATADYPTLARRPLDTRLSVTKLIRDYGINPRPWKAAVAEIVDELETEGGT